MTKTKSTKRALLTSALALLMCVSMLIGSTFAWFTDSVTSSGNIIKSGTLDVTMEWADGKTNPADTTWTDASVGAIFNSTLWEPGYTEVRHIKIANEGTLALKYQLNIIANGEVSELADVIDVYYVDPAVQVADRTALTDANKLGTLTQVLANISTTASGNLEAGENHTITLALKMQESAGNKYQGLSIGSDFSVQLLATQLTSETDSFDNQYDKYASVATVADMKTALAEGQTEFNFMGNTINLNYGLNTTAVPAGTTVTIANANVSGKSYGNGVNGTILFENCTFTNTGAYSIHFDNGTGDIIFNDCVLEGWCSFGSTINSVTMNDCTIKGNAKYAMVRFYQNAELNNCYIDCSNAVLSDVYTDGISAVTPDSYADGEFITVKLNSCTVVYAEYERSNGGVILINNTTAPTTVTNVEELSEAIESAEDGDVITLVADITGDVTVTQKADVKIVIDGNGKTYAGVILVDGKSGTYTTAGLTIKNMTFKADSISADACIRLGDGTNATRYTCNVTVENCTFDVPGAVGVKSYTGGDKNLTISGCTATANAHSLAQLKGIEGVKVENCKVYSKNGLNFNNSDNVTVDNCTVDVKGYAVRFGESSGGVGAAETYTIKNSTLKSANDDGDATIILRGTADNSTLTIENTTIVGDPDITNTATNAKVVK